MKTNIKTTVLLVGLSLVAVGCQKDLPFETNPVAGEESSMQIVTYTVDGVSTQLYIHDENTWHSFLDWMFALVEEGHRVSFYRGYSLNHGMTKEIITASFDNQHDAKEWADKKANEGYEVSVKYNSSTHMYDCVAIK